MAGISRVFFAFANFVATPSEKIKIIGVGLSRKLTEDQTIEHYNDNVDIIKIPDDHYISPYDLVKNGMTKISDLRCVYSRLIEIFDNLINQEKPDLIWLNGTYYVPWCLFEAAKRHKVPIILHYHGILSKEIEHWPARDRKIMEKMEMTFDNDRLFYIFPSNLAQDTVETDVFGHRIAKSALLPNPVPSCFYNANSTKRKKTVASIGRWSRIKNPQLFRRIAYYGHLKDNDWKFQVITDQAKASCGFNSMDNLATFLKPKKGDDLADYFANTGVIVSPSYFETYGNVAQEAIASGTPAVVSNQMGVKETFEKLGLSDWIFDVKSPVNEIYKKIIEAGKKGVSKKIRNKMMEYSHEKISKRLVKIFKSV